MLFKTHTCPKKWFQPLQARRKVLCRDVLARSTAFQVLARRPSCGEVPPVLPQPSEAVENLLATNAHVPGIPAQFRVLSWAAFDRSRRASSHTSRVELRRRLGVSGASWVGGSTVCPV